MSGKVEENIKAIQKWRALGRKFGIVTGRSLESMQEELNIHQLGCDYLGLNNGAVLVDNHHEVFYYKTLPEHLSQAVVEFVTGMPVEEMHFWGVTGRKTPEVLYDTTKIRMRTPNIDYSKQLAEQLDRAFKGHFMAIPMIAQADDFGYVEIAPHGTGKELAVSRIISKEGIGDFEVAVIGDAYNDVEMIKRYDGYAVKGAVPEVSAIATETVPSLASLIERLLSE